MNIINRVKKFLCYKTHIDRLEQRIKYGIRHDFLIDKALNDKESGISYDKYCNNDVIVSLTTYGRRLNEVASTIESIMQGSLKPNKILLWLEEGMKSDILPITLQCQKKRGLDILYCKDLRSYKKLIPTLIKYPDAVIITIDDDVIYHYDLVERLVNQHIQHPHHIIANRVHRIKLSDNNIPAQYMEWEFNNNPKDDSPLNFLTGVGGVLYPPHSLHPEVLNENTFMTICKYADDIWFYSMALLKGTRIMKGNTRDKTGCDYFVNEEVQDMGLFNINTGSGICENDVQLEAVFKQYDLYKRLKDSLNIGI